MLTPKEEKLLLKGDSDFIRSFDSSDDPDGLLSDYFDKIMVADSFVMMPNDTDEKLCEDDFESSDTSSASSLDLDQIRFRDSSDDNLEVLEVINDSNKSKKSPLIFASVTYEKHDDNSSTSSIDFDQIQSLDSSDDNVEVLNDLDKSKKSHIPEKVENTVETLFEESDELSSFKFALSYCCQRSVTLKFK